MLLTFNESENIKEEAYLHFKCQPVVTYGGNKKHNKSRKASIVEHTIDAFSSLDYYPQSPEHAVKLISPMFSWLVWFLFRQFIISVVVWLWNRLYNDTTEKG